MARRRMKQKKIRKLGTEELNRQQFTSAATSGPLNADRFGFVSSKNGKVDVCVFYARFAAKMYLDLMIGDDEIEWIGDCIQTSRDVFIEPSACQDLRDIHDHKVTYDEDRYFKLNQEYHDRARNIRSDSFAKAFIEGSTHKAIRRHSRKGMTLIKTIAAEMKMDPREARGILRSVMEKPTHGWAWRTEAEVAKIKAILSGIDLSRHITVDFSRDRHA